MPTCNRCGRVEPTVEMRRLPNKPGEFVCKDKIGCKRRIVDESQGTTNVRNGS
jgi:hypothetical protein